MQRTKEPAHIYFRDNINNAFVSKVDMWNIIKSQQHSGYELQDKKEKSNAARIIQKIVPMLRNKFTFGKPLQLGNIITLINPIFKLWPDQF
jgi:hypothetical protein